MKKSTRDLRIAKKKNKIRLLTVVAVIVVAGGVGWYFHGEDRVENATNIAAVKIDSKKLTAGLSSAIDRILELNKKINEDTEAEVATAKEAAERSRVSSSSTASASSGVVTTTSGPTAVNDLVAEAQANWDNLSSDGRGSVVSRCHSNGLLKRIQSGVTAAQLTPQALENWNTYCIKYYPDAAALGRVN